MTQEQFIEKITQKSLEQDKNNAEHPYRTTARKIIEEVIEPYTGSLDGERYYQMEDDIVALLDNLK
jgi:hypothetical protein